jgi:hypothetical protein
MIVAVCVSEGADVPHEYTPSPPPPPLTDALTRTHTLHPPPTRPPLPPSSVDSLRLRCGTALGEEPDDTAGQDEDGPGVTPVDTEGEDDDGSSPEYGDTAGRSGGAAALNDTAGGPGGALEGGDTAGGPSTPVGPARVSSWIGRGRNAVRRRWGSSECRLDCDGTNATAAAEGAAPVWRGGGLLQALTVAPGPGSMLARIELTRCSEDLDEMDEV